MLKVSNRCDSGSVVILELLSFIQKPLIPPAVTDQIRLWEMERDRFEFAHGVLYSQFLSQKDFDLLRDYARVCFLFIKVHIEIENNDFVVD